MKKLFLLIIPLIVSSCFDKVKDHYRLVDVKITIGNVTEGPNANCIELGSVSDSLYQDIMGIQIELIREYYATDSSRSGGIMYSPQGWEGCSEKIISLSFSSDSLFLNDHLYGDTLITGVGKDPKATHTRCQESDCDCRAANSLIDVQTLIQRFNSQQIAQDRLFISEKNDLKPFVYFIKKEHLAELTGKTITFSISLSDGTVLSANSNPIAL